MQKVGDEMMWELVPHSDRIEVHGAGSLYLVETRGLELSMEDREYHRAEDIVVWRIEFGFCISRRRLSFR